MIVTGAEMKALENRALAEGVTAEALMEEAGAQMAAAVRQFFPDPGRGVVFFGKGHNGGDALVAARGLAELGWAIELRPAFSSDAWAELTAQKHREFCALPTPRAAATGAPLVLLDGLLGIGAGGPLREPIRGATQEMNALRARTDARTFALDLPTGLDCDTGAADPDAVVADYTLAVGGVKAGLLADPAASYVGRLVWLPLRELSVRWDGPETARLATPATLAGLLPRRRFDTHKGECGRVGIVAGSAGLTGAAMLCAEAAVRTGAGLVTLYVPHGLEPQMEARIAPEVMVRGCSAARDILAARHDVLGVGPGMGSERFAEAREIVARSPLPLVIDADALNALAGHTGRLSNAPGPRLLTPHPGEMARLDPESATRSRRETVERFVARYPVTLLLKGSRTLVGHAGQPLSYNSTGSPGMATGGMGDVLTGVCAALAGQGLSLPDAARLGAWLCGRAAELALLPATGQSEESLTPTRLLQHLGPAFRALRDGGF